MKKYIYIAVVFLISVVYLNAKDLRIEPKELNQSLNSYKIIDVRDQEKYSLGHITGALNLPINLTYEHKSINGKITEPNKMQGFLREIGIDINDKIAVYDDGTYFDAARLFWTLEVYGFKDVKLLNAGFEEWETLNMPISTQAPKPKKSSYVASINNKRLATKFTTQIATKNPKQVIIDARKYNAYIGKESSAIRYGHIPKAIHIPATHNITNNSSIAKLKSLAELQETYKDISKDKKVVIYCAVGRISSTNYFALRELGYDVANYDASWKEWGNDFNLPIVNKTKK